LYLVAFSPRIKQVQWNLETYYHQELTRFID
jgi:hypothetical protein